MAAIDAAIDWPTIIAAAKARTYGNPESGSREFLSPEAVSAARAVDQWARLGLVVANPSFGFAMATPGIHAGEWDDPSKLCWLACGWGSDGDRYIANAVRKLRAAVRTSVDTLEMRRTRPELFRGGVASVESDGTYAWGDFPWGGAVHLWFMGRRYTVAVSCLSEAEDHTAALTVGGLVAKKMALIDGRLPIPDPEG